MTPTRPTPVRPLAPRESSDRDLPARIQRSAGPVGARLLVVESYFAGWEKPWRALSAEAWHELFHELGQRFTGAVVETGRNRELAVRYGLEIIPTVLVFLGGEVVARFSGRVEAEEVVVAVRAALEHARTLASDTLELQTASAAHERPSPVRSILRRRSSQVSEHALAHAG